VLRVEGGTFVFNPGSDGTMHYAAVPKQMLSGCELLARCCDLNLISRLGNAMQCR